MVSADRCFNLLDIPQENGDGKQSEETANWPSQGEIEFSDVHLKYRPNTECVLMGLNFKVNAGERVGVVGRTGAGKSTICLSMSRIVELMEGKIMIDGVDIKSVQLDHLRSRITVIPQDPTIFSGTLRFNLDPEGKADAKSIIEILKKA